MKKITYFIALLFTFNLGFGQEIVSFSSVQNTTCSGVISINADISATGICRGTGVYETIVGSPPPSTYNSTGWTIDPFIDLTEYLEWTVTPNAGHQISLTTMNLKYDRSGTGPKMVDIQVDAGSGFTSVFTDAAVSLSGENIDGVDLSAYINVTETITFRLYAYNASATGGTFDIEERISPNKGIILNGVVSAIPCVGSPITWNGSVWSPVSPITTSSVIITGDYNTSVVGSGFTACSLTVNAGATLTVANGDYVEIINDVVVDLNGKITVQSQGNFVQNSGTATFTDNSSGGVVVSKNKTMQKWYTYTYWSSPTATETIQGVLGNTPTDRRFTFNAANYADILAEIGNTNTFTSGQDGFDDNGDDWVNTPTGPMVPGVGYAATASEFGPAFPRPELFNFYGAFNNGEVLVTLISNSGGVYEDWNLVGNPYPGAISADQFFSVNTGLVDAIYLWDQGTPPSSSASGNQNSNFSANDYAIINGIGTVSAGGTGLPPNRFIPSGQGFFVDANSAGNLTFNNSMRAITHDNSQFFKSSKVKMKSKNSDNKLWVNLTSDNGVFKQIMIGYVDGATNGNDGAFYDTARDLTSLFNTSLYSVIDSDNSKLAIQGKDINSLDINEVIKLGFKATIKVATLYKLSIAQLQGDFLTNNAVYLKDNLLNKTHDLSASDYTFTSEVGEFNNRFEIVFRPAGVLSTDETALNENMLSIVELENDLVQFATSNNLKIQSVSVFDLLGRQLYLFKGENSTETYRLSNLSSTVYIAKVVLSNGIVMTKKAVKK